MGALITVSDLQVQNGEPKVQDLVLAKALGFSNPHQIRPLIKRHLSALNAFGEVSPTWEKPGAKGGRPSRMFFLNEEQAIYITAKSDTPRAAEITVEMVRVFRDYLKGEVKTVKVRSPRRNSLTARLAAIEQRLQEIAPASSFPDLPEGIGAIILNGEPVFYDSRDTAIEKGRRFVVLTTNGEVKVDIPRELGRSYLSIGPRSAMTSIEAGADLSDPWRGETCCMILGKVVERRALAHHAAREIAAH